MMQFAMKISEESIRQQQIIQNQQKIEEIQQIYIEKSNEILTSKKTSSQNQIQNQQDSIDYKFNNKSYEKEQGQNAKHHHQKSKSGNLQYLVNQSQFQNDDSNQPRYKSKASSRQCSCRNSPRNQKSQKETPQSFIQNFDKSHLFKSADNLDQIKFFVSKNNENLQSPFNIKDAQNYTDYQQNPYEYQQKNKSVQPYDNQQYQQNQYESPFQQKKSDKKTQHLAILNKQLKQLQKYSETMLQARNKQEDYMEEQQRQINSLQQELQSKIRYPDNNQQYLSQQQQLQQQSYISKSPKFSFNYTPKNYERPTYTSKLKLRSKEMSQVSTGVVGSPQSQFNQ